MGERADGIAWRRDPVLWSLAAAGAVIVVVYAASLGSDGFRDRIYWPLQPPLDLAFAICCHRVCTHPAANAAERKFWRALRMSGFVFVAGDLYLSTATLAGHQQGWFPSVDVHTIVIAAGVLRAAWATLVHPVRWEGRERLRLWLDLTAAVAGGGVFVWYFWLGSAELAPGELVASAVTGTLMLASAFGIGKLMLGGEAPFTRLTGISGALSVLAFAAAASLPPSLVDTWNADLVHLAWVFPGVTMAVTPRLHELELRRRSGTDRQERHPRRGQSWLPYLALAASQVLLIVAVAGQNAMDRRVAGVLTGVSVILALIVYRQILVIRDNAALVTRLDASLTELAGFQDRLWHEARHDQLTQLANRTLLHERIEAAIEATARGAPEEQRVALLLLDLDRFKAVNDTLGHHVGDALLVHVAEQLRGHVRATDTVARLGGDEFVVLLPGGTEREAQTLAHRLQTAFLGGVVVDGQRLDVGASIGVAAGLLQDAETLMRQADADMYRVKEIAHAGS
jgi:diguanylate cyclase (GGDEF)-like protein